jgi:hypothetical protein
MSHESPVADTCRGDFEQGTVERGQFMLGVDD